MIIIRYKMSNKEQFTNQREYEIQEDYETNIIQHHYGLLADNGASGNITGGIDARVGGTSDNKRNTATKQINSLLGSHKD